MSEGCGWRLWVFDGVWGWHCRCGTDGIQRVDLTQGASVGARASLLGAPGLTTRNKKAKMFISNLLWMASNLVASFAQPLVALLFLVVRPGARSSLLAPIGMLRRQSAQANTSEHKCYVALCRCSRQVLQYGSRKLKGTRTCQRFWVGPVFEAKMAMMAVDKPERLMKVG